MGLNLKCSDKMAKSDLENGIPEAKRYINYAQAYLQASLASCCRMVERRESNNWPNASVVLMLAAHSLEHFMKGALLAKGSICWSHDLEGLHEQYVQEYPGNDFELKNPFKVDYIGFEETEVAAIRSSAGIPSIRYRYPVKKPGCEWGEASEMCPTEFMGILDELNERYENISGLLWGI